MASGDAKPFPLKNSAYRVTFPILDSDGDLVTGAASLDSEISKDGGTFTDCTNEATEIATNSGMYYLDLTSTEMNTDCVAIIIKTTTAGAKTTPMVLYPVEDSDIPVNVKEVNGTAQTANDNGADINSILSTVNHTDHGNAKLVRSTTPANALDVSGTGEAGLDFDNIKNASGAHTLTNITVPTVTALTGKTGFSLLSTGADLILKNSTFALAIADAVADEEYTGATHNVVNSLGRRVREIGAYAIHSGTAQAGNATCITLAATASAIDGTYNRNLLVLTDNTGVGQTRTIIDYDGSTKIAIVDREWRTNPDATSEYQIVADDTPLVVDQGVAQVGSTSSTIKLRAYASSINDTYLCNIVIIVAGTGRGQARLVGAYDGTSKVVTLCGDNWVTTPDDTSVYVMIPYGATCTSCVGDDALAQINAEIGIAKNVALPKFDFYMVLSSDHVSAATGKTVTGEISKDGGAFVSITNSITEVSDGMYTIADGFTQTEMNADVITLKFTETDCDQRIITIYTT